MRFFGYYNSDGNFFLGECRLKPYLLPVKSSSEKINTYLISRVHFAIYGPFLGWSIKPGGVSKDRSSYTNSDGIRTPASNTFISKEPNDGVLRIAIFGDSFTYSANVPFENTFGYYLESNLKRRGINA